jgi:hypothetical protein
MLLQTWADLKAEIKKDLDLEEEIFIDDTELMSYGNKGLDECEADIHTLYEDYYLRTANITLVNGTALYSLPTDIYGNKIRLLQYDDGTTKYEIKRILDLRKIADIDSNSDYSYFIVNTDVTTGIQIKLVPASRESSTTTVTIYYLRNAERITSDASKIDIPEFKMFLYLYVKCKCAEKEQHPLLQNWIDELQAQRQKMRETLADMVPDDAGLEADMSFYYEMN